LGLRLVQTCSGGASGKEQIQKRTAIWFGQKTWVCGGPAPGRPFPSTGDILNWGKEKQENRGKGGKPVTGSRPRKKVAVNPKPAKKLGRRALVLLKGPSRKVKIRKQGFVKQQIVGGSSGGRRGGGGGFYKGWME